MTTQLKERPLVLTTEEVNAVLAGHKTQHRVIFDFAIMQDHNCPFGKVGDRLWVKEDFIPDPPAGHDAWEDEDSVTNYFQWDGCGSKLSEIPNRLRTSEYVIYKAGQDDPDSMMWFNALQMRKWASRLLLEITDINIQRVQDISESDAKAMGLKPDYCDHKYQSCEDIGCIGKWAEPLMNYFIHEKNIANVSSHDWVWVIEFKKVDD